MAMTIRKLALYRTPLLHMEHYGMVQLVYSLKTLDSPLSFPEQLLLLAPPLQYLYRPETMTMAQVIVRNFGPLA